MRSRITVAAFVTLTLVACASSADTQTEPTSSAPGAGSTPPTPAITASDKATDGVSAPIGPSTTVDTILESSLPPDASGWQDERVEIGTTGVETGAGESGAAEVLHIAATSTGFVAVGRYAGQLAIWGSDRFDRFAPLYNEVCCDRYVSPTALAEFDGTLLVGGTARQRGTDREFSVLMRSDDGGVTWDDIDHPLVTENADHVEAIHVVGDSVIVQVDAHSDGLPGDSRIARSTDLSTWVPVQLPGSRDGDSPSLVTDGDTVFATAFRDDQSGGRGSMMVWSSTDAGRTFEQRPPIPRNSGHRLVVDGALVVVDSAPHVEPSHTEPPGLDVLAPAGDWSTGEPDVGQFGDGASGVGAAATAPDGRTYALVGREIRASAHYCYQDIETCNRLEAVLVAATGPTQWFDVAGLELPLYAGPESGLVVAADGTIVFWAQVVDESALDVRSWTSVEAPALADPPTYPPPDIPLELIDPRDRLEVGDEFRYVLPLGGCGGMYLDDTLWEPETPLPDPVPNEWPYRPERPGTGDGPTGYVFGRVERTAEDTIELSIEDVGTVAIYHPAPPPEYQCG